MNIFILRYKLSIIFGLLLCLSLSASYVPATPLQKSERSGAKLNASFLYMLSDFSGVVPSQWALLAIEPKNHEVYTLIPGSNELRIYNAQGMQIFVTSDESGVASVSDIAVTETGDIYLLPRNFTAQSLQILNFRGELQSTLRLKGLPPDYRNFGPELLEYRDGRFYLFEPGGLRIVEVAADGGFLHAYDLRDKITALGRKREPDKKKKEQELSGSDFCVGVDGSLYLTVPTLFSVFILKPDGTLDSFGVSGSGPGKFGVVSGVTSDDHGNIYVADRLRSVVMIFSRGYEFLGEFGYRGSRPEDMIVPDDLVLDQQSAQVYVSQAANKGVGVYQIRIDNPAPEQPGTSQ
ncbi:hypothetical protein [Geopsychrobacter electrodiphilus]|uniref:hypothetical protein n=1 Tax=Geopsychrobacter electrodiphilus TaxID=225196 RepID=UPI000378A3CF|nr:hypothetical protein [Geopsychrobacter electrodiphilus]